MTDPLETLKTSIQTLAESKKYVTLRDILSTMNAADIASLFEDNMPEEIIPLLYRLLPKELAADTFVEMDPETQQLLIKGFSDNELKEVVDELYVDDAVDLVEEMPANVVKRILSQADAEKRKQKLAEITQLQQQWKPKSRHSKAFMFRKANGITADIFSS